MLLSCSMVTQKPDPFGQDFSSKYLSFSKAWTSNLLYSTVTSGVEMQQKQRMVQVSLYFQLIPRNILLKLLFNNAKCSLHRWDLTLGNASKHFWVFNMWGSLKASQGPSISYSILMGVKLYSFAHVSFNAQWLTAFVIPFLSFAVGGYWSGLLINFPTEILSMTLPAWWTHSVALATLYTHTSQSLFPHLCISLLHPVLFYNFNKLLIFINLIFYLIFKLIFIQYFF